MDFGGSKKLKMRHGMYAAVIFLSAVLYHSGFIPDIGSASAMIMAPLCVSIAIHEKSIPSMAFGMLCGALWDLGVTQADGFYTVMMTAAGFICSSLSKFIVRKNLLSCLALTFLSVSLCSISYWGNFYLIKGYEGAWGLLLSYYLPSVIYTLVFGAVYYYITAYIVRNTKEKKRRI